MTWIFAELQKKIEINDRWRNLTLCSMVRDSWEQQTEVSISTELFLTWCRNKIKLSKWSITPIVQILDPQIPPNT